MTLKDLLKIDFTKPELNEDDLLIEAKKAKIKEKKRLCISRINTLGWLIEKDNVDDGVLIARDLLTDLANLAFLLNNMDVIEEPYQLEKAVAALKDKEIADRFLNNDQIAEIINKRKISIAELKSLYVYINDLFQVVKKRADEYNRRELKTPVSAFRKKIIFQLIFYPCFIIITVGTLYKISGFAAHRIYISRYDKLPVLENGYNYKNFLKTWLILGDIPEQVDHDICFRTDFLTENGGEKKILPSEGMEHHFKNNTVSKWKSYKSSTDYINLHKTFNVKKHTTAYAFTILESPFNQKANLAVGSDDGVKVWLNGILVHQANTIRPATIDQDKIPVQLRKGKNSILVKVTQAGGEWGFFCRLLKITISPT